jgi:hypothetical protein
MRGMGSALGRGIINGWPMGAGRVSEVVEVESRGILY